MLYGFALPSNPHDQLMVACPLPPRSERGDETVARLQLLSERGLRPQLFLPAAHLARAKAAGGAAPWRHDGSGSVLPPEARRVLEVFVMDAEEVARQLDEGEAAAGGSSSSGSSTSSRSSSGRAASSTELVERLGSEMALITTLVRLLELQVLELEGDEEGTGPLEADEARLAEEPDRLAPWLRACLLYRAGQKRLARLYLAAARGELQGTLRALRAAVDAEEAERERGEERRRAAARARQE